MVCLFPGMKPAQGETSRVLIEEDFSSYTPGSAPHHPEDANPFEWQFGTIRGSKTNFSVEVAAGESVGAHDPGNVMRVQYTGPDSNDEGGDRTGIWRQFEAIDPAHYLSATLTFVFRLATHAEGGRHMLGLGPSDGIEFRPDNIRSNEMPGGVVLRTPNRLEIVSARDRSGHNFLRNLERGHWYRVVIEYDFTASVMHVTLENLSEPGLHQRSRTEDFVAIPPLIGGFALWPVSSSEWQLDQEIAEINVTAIPRDQ